MADVVFIAEDAEQRAVLEIRRIKDGKWEIGVGSPTYQYATYDMKPEEQADLAEALLRALDTATRQSVMSVKY